MWQSTLNKLVIEFQSQKGAGHLSGEAELQARQEKLNSDLRPGLSALSLPPRREPTVEDVVRIVRCSAPDVAQRGGSKTAY